MKIFMRFASFLVCICVIFLCLSSCKAVESKEKFTKTYYEYFDTVTTVTGYAESKEDFLKANSIIEARLSEYHKLYDAYHSKTDAGYEESYANVTNIKDINAVVGTEHVMRKVDKRIIDLLLYCKEIYELTGGETNVAMGSVLKLWHDEREFASKNPSEAKLPDPEKLEAASKHTDINKLIIDKENSTVLISDPEMTIDVGAVAKGYATEMIARELEAEGFDGYALSVGGNVRTVGAKPGGEKWSVGIENPTDALSPYVETVYVAGESVVTSGSYQRYYVVDGKKYHHITDKDTLYPSEYFDSVSVITKDSALADALSTALFSMPIEDGMALINGIDGAEAIWISKSGEKHVSAGFSAYIAN